MYNQIDEDSDLLDEDLENAPTQEEVLPPEDEPHVTLESIRHSKDVLSVEAIAGLDALKNAVSRLPSFFAKTGQFFKQTLGSFSKSNQDHLFKAHGLENIYRKVDRLKYSDIQNILVHVPEGLQVSLLHYTRALKKAGEVCDKLLPNVLIPYCQWLGNTLADPSILSVRTPKLNITNFQQLTFEPIEKELQACFVTHGQRTHKMAYSKAFNRNQDILDISKELDSLNKLFSTAQHRSIIEYTKRTTDILDTLIETIKNNNGINVSPVTVKTLAETTYHVARLVEQYGLFRFRLLELDHSIKETSKILKSKT